MKLRTKFEDEDFKLGEVVEANVYYGGSERIKVIAEPTKGGMITFYFETLKGLNEMFEDAPEEPKGSALDLMVLTLINFIENEPDEDKVDLEDCKQMLEKLKALKRLKEAGFEFGGWTHTPITESVTGYNLHIKAYTDKLADYMDDLQLLFSGEDD